MGLTVWILIINDDDSIRRLPLTKYERLMKRDSTEHVPEYAGKRVRYAEVVVDLEQKKPVGIININYSVMAFDSKGSIDPTERDQRMQLAMNIVPTLDTDQEYGNVVDAGHVFAKRRFDSRFKWKPTPEIEQAIVDFVFR